MTKVIFRQVESYDIDFLYDDDGITEASGKNNALYVIVPDSYRKECITNTKEYNELVNMAENIAEDFSSLLNGWNRYFTNYKEVLKYYGMAYSPIIVHKLKEWTKEYEDNASSIDALTAYLTITTGEAWETYTASGYSQGDYATGIYCVGHYTEEALELYVGAAAGTVSEFCRIEDNDRCYGYYVPDSVTWRDNDLREYLANMCGDDPNDIEIEVFDGYTTTPNYRTI